MTGIDPENQKTCKGKQIGGQKKYLKPGRLSVLKAKGDRPGKGVNQAASLYS